MAEKKNILTYEGLRKLEEELEDLKVVKRKEISQKIKEAREQGDLSENAEYDAAKDEQRDIEARIEQIEKILKNAEVVDEDEVDLDKISIGCKVKILDVEFDEEEEFKIVGSSEASSLKGKISNESPVGKALLGAKVGDTVKVKVLSLGDGKKISLSIKQTVEAPPKPQGSKSSPKPRQRRPYTPAPSVTSPGNFEWQSSKKDAPQSFEDMMNRFKQTSDEKFSDLKKKNPEMRIALCGCMMQEPEVVEKLKKSYKFVDIIFGTHNIFKFAELIVRNFEEKGMIIDIWKDTEEIVEDLPVERKYSFKSGVNIMFGCNNFCSYCIVPYVRGRERSRKPEDIIREIENLVKEGVVEVMLLGQNVNSYGKDLEDKPTIASLLNEINKIEVQNKLRAIAGAFANDSFLLLQQRHWIVMLIYIIASVVLGILMVWLGRALVK